ncbi:MAG: alpha/beta fold hydrolase [Spirochaetaceae bacterium]|nr:MAG: alpha/beta fold hydrolase [Spirochaetaceae bacterium]
MGRCRCADTASAPMPLLLVLLLVALVPAQPWAQPGELLSVMHEKGFLPHMVLEETAVLFEEFGVPEVNYAVDRYWIRFRSSDFDKSEVTARAQLFVPRLDRPAERPVLVFGAGTTGIAERCAPILEVPELNRWGWYLANMLAYAGKGYIVIFPEYIGFGIPDTPQRYFSKVAEAHVMLDAVRAVYNVFEREDIRRRTQARPSQTVFAAGYSQGGHAAHAAADLRPDYAPEIPLSGLIGFGQTNNVATLMREMAYYAPYIIYTYAEMYGYDEINPADYLQQRWLPTLEQDMYRFCVEEFQFYYPRDGKDLYTRQFYQALTENRLAEKFPAMAARLDENMAGLSGHGIPTLVLHGERDIIITTPEQTRFVEQLCERNTIVEYVIMPGARHRDTRPAGFQRSVEWMELITRGEEPPDDCPLP